MLWKDAIRLAGSNLRQTPLRALLTTSGVIIGIGMLVCMVGFGLGLKKLTTEQVRKYAYLNTITVFPQFENPRRQNRDPSPVKSKPLDDRLLEEIAAIPGVRSAYPVVTFPAEIITGDTTLPITGTSLSPSENEQSSIFQLAEGRLFRPESEFEIVVHQEILDSISSDPVPGVGDTLHAVILFAPTGTS